MKNIEAVSTFDPYEGDIKHYEPIVGPFYRDPRPVIESAIPGGRRTWIRTGKLSGMVSALVWETFFERPESTPVGVPYKLKRTQKFLGRKFINPFFQTEYYPGT